ncbi:unnamed protein product [Cochlearia groenlandica]
MDLETENRIASILLRQAAELRRQAEKDGVRACSLEKPNNVRHRPNTRFLTATVLGVQQSNKAVETNEMWRLRQQELELEEYERLNRISREGSSGSFLKKSLDKRKVTNASSEKRWSSEDDQGIGDDEIESFLQSRIKRGRGTIGPRMDETGPYLPIEKVEDMSQSSAPRERKVVLGPERPPSLRKDSQKKPSKKYKKTEKKRKQDRH